MTVPSAGWSFTRLGRSDLITPSWFPGTTSTAWKMSRRVPKNQGIIPQSMSWTFPIECLTSPTTMTRLSLFFSAIEFILSSIFCE